MLRGVVALAAVLILLLALSWMFKKMLGRKSVSGSVAKIIGGVSLGTRERLIVVEVGSRWIVVGVAPGAVRALANIEPSTSLPHVAEGSAAGSTEPSSVSVERTPSLKFSDLFARLRDK